MNLLQLMWLWRGCCRKINLFSFCIFWASTQMVTPTNLTQSLYIIYTFIVICSFIFLYACCLHVHRICVYSFTLCSCSFLLYICFFIYCMLAIHAFIYICPTGYCLLIEYCSHVPYFCSFIYSKHSVQMFSYIFSLDFW